MLMTLPHRKWAFGMPEHPHAAVLRAIAKGRQIEVRINGGNWQLVTRLAETNPFVLPDAEWRIAPEPRLPREVWIGEFSDGVRSDVNWETQEGCEHGHEDTPGFIRAVLFREVLNPEDRDG